jgi:hypothetical protein
MKSGRTLGGRLIRKYQCYYLGDQNKDEINGTWSTHGGYKKETKDNIKKEKNMA